VTARPSTRGSHRHTQMHHSRSRLSNTVAGAALGIATAKFVLNRQDAQARGTVQFQPVKTGWLISDSIRTH
jgi:hypothetical protein